MRAILSADCWSLKCNTVSSFAVKRISVLCFGKSFSITKRLFELFIGTEGNTKKASCHFEKR